MSDSAHLYPVPQSVICFRLDLTYLKEHRGRRTPLASVLARVINWVHDLGVAVAGAANVAVPVDDLRPRAKDVQITLDAVDDIRFCENLFDKWMAELDKCVANRFSRYRVPYNVNNGFTESRATPRSQMDESKR
jgi:hypothetical protein